MKENYSHKIPTLPYKKEKNNKHPNQINHPKNHDCKSDTTKRPEPFDGIDKRKKESARQHFPSLTIHIDFIGQQNTMRYGGDMIISVTNNGNGTAYTPFVELIESEISGLSVEPPELPPK